MEYRRQSIIARHNYGAASSSGNGVGGTASSAASANLPRFSEYSQVPLCNAIARALRGMSAESDSETDAGMALSRYLNRSSSNREKSVIWDYYASHFH
ncbi:hypothetical protein HDU81_009482 [Chytriomyces hyalinus]|nr:hypothetical protein HDU81_009482 [Chytriomyces hyalinus]